MVFTFRFHALLRVKIHENMQLCWKIVIGVCIVAVIGFIVYRVAHGGIINHQGGRDKDHNLGTSIDTSKVAYTITVSQSGDANFTSIQDALDAIPSGNKQWIRIFVHPGVYKEKIKIDESKEFIVLEGSDRSSTTITYGAHDSTTDSSTFAVHSDNFVAKDVTFKNSIAQNDVQAVAFRTSGDKHAYYSCGFEGYQDTLWDDQGRHYFHSCYIEGAVDFIWGRGQSVYEGCTINVVGDGFITAQGRKSSTDSNGFVFRDCDVSGSGDVFLGRAYGPYARVIFIESKFSNVIDPKGWFIWHQDGHKEDVTFVESDCTGPGADTSERVPWTTTLSSSDIAHFSTQEFIDNDDWISKLP